MEKAVQYRRHPKRLLFLCLLQIMCVAAYAQSTKQVRGKITDSNNSPLPGANVQVMGTTVGASSNAEGIYTINVPNAESSLIFSFIGYKSQEVQVGNQTQINISLVADEALLNEVLVIGYGTQSRETVTTAITKVDSKALESIPYANAASALQGTVSGVRVQSTSGQPGAAPRVIVRGGTSINNPDGASPLYIIDGVMRPQMDNIAPEDIESMQVLKDAASTAIYGARGSNGVVIITTKSGKSGKTTASYRYDFTVSDPGKLYKLANARDYLTTARLGEIAGAKFPKSTRLGLPMGYGTGNDLTNNTAFSTQYLTDQNRYKLDEGWQSMPDPVDPTKTIIFSDTDFQKLTYQRGISHNNHLNVSGGTDKASFNAGLGYLSNQGTVITTKYNRLTFSLNGDVQVSKNLSVFSRVLYTNAQQNTPGFGTNVVFYRSAGLAPTAKFRFEDGSLAPGTNSGIGNPVYFMNNRVNESNTDNLTLSFGGQWRILPGLTFDPQISLFNINTDGYAFQPSFLNGPLSPVNTREANASNYRWNQRQADGVFSYVKSIANRHNFDSKLGYSYFDRKISNLSARGRGASTDLIPTLNASSEPTAVSSNISKQIILGVFARVNYDYDQKYLLSLNARYDGASNLGEKNKWGFFPGISVGWNVYREEFWKSLPPDLLRLKLRASYGVNGNISGLSDFTSQGEYGVGTRYNGNAAIDNTVIPNPNLKWEQSKTFNVGADVGLFQSRINILFDYYRRVTDNLITRLPLPQSTGFANVLTNLGSLENRGFEVELSAQVLPSTSSLQWNLSFNASQTKNKILQLPPNGIPNNRVGGFFVWDPALKDYVWKGGLQEGGRIGDMYTRNSLGIYPTDEAASNAPTDTYIVLADKKKYGGDTEWEDRDGNGIIDGRDRIFVGNSFPTWTGGISNTLSYKGLSLYLRMDYTTGHTIFNWAKLFLDINGYGDGVMTQDVVDRSWKEQGDMTDLARYYWGGERTQRNTFDGTSTSGSSTYYQRGDFLCVREATFSYNLPRKALDGLRISGLRFNVTGSNLFYFTKYLGLNPEEGGRDDGRYAMPRNITVGANLTF